MLRSSKFLLFLVLLLGTVGCSLSRSQATRVIVIGVDGMDPGFVQEHWRALPNLSRLGGEGSFKTLQTTMPPLSPVAWASFITGTDPAEHGLFDFVHRNPATMQPFSSMTRTEEPRFTLSLGEYLFPLSSARVISLRRGKAFWQILAEHHVPVTVVRMPTNYPPVESAGRALAGMGVPDLRGTFGTFTFYTDDPEEISRDVSGGRIVKVPPVEDHVVLPVEGPENSLRKDRRMSSVDLTVDIDPEAPVARLVVGDSQVIVRQGEWSDWMRAEFPLVRGLVNATGMFRVYAKELRPSFALYVSPVNVDPDDPELPISAPSSFSRAIGVEAGRFYTQGIAEDTGALRQGVFNLPEYLSQSRLVFDDEHKLLDYTLHHFHQGLLFVYISSIDQNSHMLWGKHESELLDTYRAVDAAIGDVLNQSGGADVIVMSDHGFTTFDRAVHLNTWLWKEGFLALNGPPGAETPFAHVDWSKTRAYALGLNGLYLNLSGREKQGIVHPGAEAQDLLTKITERLLQFRDPANRRQVVEKLDAPHANAGVSPFAPDLIVGYGRGYRASWQTALGALPEQVIDDNNDPWIGDHCSNAKDVPGVLFSRLKVRAESPRLKDLTVSILALFGVPPDAAMSGQTLY